MQPSESLRVALAVLMLSVLLFHARARAQSIVADTIDAAQYFPLAIGNQWHYVNEDSTISKRWFVAADSVVADTLYFRLLDSFFDADGVATTGTSMLRYDSTSATVFERIHIGKRQFEQPWFELPGCLDAEAGLVYVCEAVGGFRYDVTYAIADVVVGADTVENVIVKGFGTIGGSYGFAAGIGLLGRGYEASTASHKLVYAYVDGRAFGQPVTATRTRDAGPLPSAIIESLFPNPASSAIHVQYNSRPGTTCAYRVVDILGRRVADSGRPVDCTGEWSVQVDTLPSGHYVLVATIDGVVDARRFVVTAR